MILMNFDGSARDGKKSDLGSKGPNSHLPLATVSCVTCRSDDAPRGPCPSFISSILMLASRNNLASVTQKRTSSPRAGSLSSVHTHTLSFPPSPLENALILLPWDT